MSKSFSKLFSCITTSTIWQEPLPIKIVWITMLSLAEWNGDVMASIPGLAKTAGVSVEECEEALNKFMSPDKYSRTKVQDGRRIKEIDGGWNLINYSKYRDIKNKENNREYMREYMSNRREVVKNVKNVKPNVKDVRNVKSMLGHTDTDTDTDTDTEKNKKEPLTPKGEVSLTETELPFNTKEFKETWESWVNHRNEIKHPLKPSMIKSQLKQFKQWGEAHSMDVMEYTIRQGWQGLAEPRQEFKRQSTNSTSNIPDDTGKTYNELTGQYE